MHVPHNVKYSTNLNFCLAVTESVTTVHNKHGCQSCQTQFNAFDRIKDVDPWSECVVFGFIRCIEQSLSQIQSIPIEIFSMCLLYFYNPEYFTKHGDHIILKDDNKTMEHDLAPAFDTVYGNLEIDKGHYIECSWTFEINKLAFDTIIGIGMSCGKEIVNDIFTDHENTFAYESYDRGEIYGKGVLKGLYGCRLHEGDIVEMTLNVENKTLRYSVNSKDQGIAVQDIDFDDDIKYVMAIYSDEQSIVKLLDFQVTYKK